MSAAVLRVDAIGKTFPGERGREQLEILRAISFQAAAGEFVSIIGPSGCGKTTLLRILHGLEPAGAGTVDAGGTRAMVFQHFNLFPWLTVLRNVAFGLEVAGLPAAECRERAQNYVRLVGLEAFADHYPHELSGGMRQRVGLARALVLNPQILFLDEPFGALDAITRELMQREVAGILQQSPRTVILVTHSMDEAIFFSDRILVLSRRPARVLEEVRVQLSRPRDPGAIHSSPEAAALRKRLWNLLSAGGSDA